MPKKRTWSKDQLADAVSSSASRRQVLSKLGLKDAGGSYAFIKAKIEEYDLDTSHFTGMLWSRGKKIYPIQDYLSNKRRMNSNKLRERLVKEGILENKCYSCQRTEWLGKPIPLELEHKNGVKKDNSLSNLTILCPNCHAFTPTYRRRKSSLKSPRQESNLHPT